MSKHIRISILLTLLTVTITQNVCGQLSTHAANYFHFLRVSSNASTAALADAMTAREQSSSAMFNNPAAMAWMPAQLSVVVSQNQWIANINYYEGNVAVQTPIGVLGFNGMIGDRGLDFKIFNKSIDHINKPFGPDESVFGFGFAKSVTDRFALGGVVKYATNNLFSIVVKTDYDIEVKWTSHSTIGFDFGTLYRTGIMGLNLGVAVRNYSKTLNNTSGPYISPSFVRYGLSMNLLSFTTLKPENHSLMFALDYEDPLSFDEHYNLGLEYTLLSTYVLRIGYKTPYDENKINIGLGINDFIGFSLDYAWSDMGIFGNIHRFSVGYQF